MIHSIFFLLKFMFFFKLKNKLQFACLKNEELGITYVILL